MSKIKQNNPTLDIIFYKQCKILKVQEKLWHYRKRNYVDHNSKYNKASKEGTIQKFTTQHPRLKLGYSTILY